MKCSILVASLACLLSSAWAVNVTDPRVEQVQSEFMDYIAENIGGIRMMRGSVSHIKCYDEFIPLVNKMAEVAKTESEKCVASGDTLKQQALDLMTEGRERIAAEVLRIQTDLNSCTANTNSLGYIKCLLDINEKDKQILENIKTIANSLLNVYQDAVNNIDGSEQTCLLNAVNSAKQKSDKAFEDLRNCLVNGLPVEEEPAQPEPAQPEPAQPEPVQPEPVQPEPAQP